MKPTGATQRSWTPYLILAVTGIHLISACWHILYGGQNSDEGFYAIAARSVWQGDLPYRDFGYTQTPLLPYINGLVMQITGFGLFEQRAINGLWGALTLLLGSLWLARRTSSAWAIGFAAIFSLSAPWMYFIHLGKTYAFIGLVAVAALWVYTEWVPGARKAGTLAFLGVLGAGCRLPIAPYFAALWIAAVVELPAHSGKALLRPVLYSFMWPAVLVLPFYLVAPESAYFWTSGLHQAATLDRVWRLPGYVIIALAPAVWLALLVGLIHAGYRPKVHRRADLVAAAATLVGLACNLLPRGVFEEYGVPLLPSLGLVAATGLWQAGSARPWIRFPLVPVVLVALNLGAGVALQWRVMPAERRYTWSMFLPLNAPAYNYSLPASLAQARRAVEHYLPPGDPFVGPVIILAAETGRIVPRRLRMGPFTATADFQAPKAHRLNLTTIAELESYFTDPGVPLLAFSKMPYLNYSMSMPSFQGTGPFKALYWGVLFKRNFLVVYEDADFLLLARKPPLPPPDPE